MSKVKENKGKLWMVALVGLVVGIVLIVGAQKTLEYTDSPEFCASCHIMKAPVATMLNSSHAQLSCNDCHLPHESTVGKLVSKARVGLGHIYYNNFASSKIPDVMQATDWAIEVVDENCRSCHSNVLTDVAHDAKELCTDCHRGMPHGKQFFKTDEFKEPANTSVNERASEK